LTQYHTLHVFGHDYPQDAPWRLLEWCRQHDAAEFSVNGILADGGSRAAFEAFDRIADPHRLPQAIRYDVAKGAQYPVELWRLCDETVSALRVAFPQGYFSYSPADAWFEDLLVYRANGALMLGVITHEQEGVLRVTEEERDVLARAALPVRTEGEWVGINEAAV
jgi:hypothetical protein